MVTIRADGQGRRRENANRVEVKDRESIFHFPMRVPHPRAVRFDPEFDILKTFRHKRGRESAGN